MLKIGEFARLGQVSVVTLRHYDDCGLLKPTRIDNFTGYRYYSVSLLPRLNRILALKDLGFSLEQIEQVLNGDVTHEQLHGMLTLKYAQVEQRVAAEQARLARIAARLRQIELEDTMSQYDVILKKVPAQVVISQQITIPTNDEVPEYLAPVYKTVWGHVHEQNAEVAGTAFTIWHQSPEVVTDEVVEVVVPIKEVVPADGDVKVYELRETEVASAVHDGNFENFSQAHFAILKWMEDNGYEPIGGYREIYIKHDPDNLNESTTEIQFPIKKVSEN